MYEYFSGRLVEKNPAYVIIDNQGIGYLVNISLNTFEKIKDSESVKLYVHFVVREDAQILYGFADEAERFLFRALISVSGVGANTARLVLSSLTTSEAYNAISTGDTAILQSVKGIGAKTAQRIVVDLRSEEHTSELQSHSFISYAVFCLKKKNIFFFFFLSFIFGLHFDNLLAAFYIENAVFHFGK